MNSGDNSETTFLISSIMMKLPTKNLGHIREKFYNNNKSLNLSQFITAITQNMELPSGSDASYIVADLIDFFEFVDVDGDGNLITLIL